MEIINKVDSYGNRIGSIEKLEAHKQGVLHEAFSIFIFNSKGELLLQKRAENKYHSGSLWTNTCCSHPRYGEDLATATVRRLQEEMGFHCPLKEVFTFTYKVDFQNGLTENEFDHVFVGMYNGRVNPNREEVEDCKWITESQLIMDIAEKPEEFTYWLKMIMADRGIWKVVLD